jgi:hypothetical protein
MKVLGISRSGPVLPYTSKWTRTSNELEGKEQQTDTRFYQRYHVMKEDIEMLHFVASILLGVQAGSPVGVHGPPVSVRFRDAILVVNVL